MGLSPALAVLPLEDCLSKRTLYPAISPCRAWQRPFGKLRFQPTNLSFQPKDGEVSMALSGYLEYLPHRFLVNNKREFFHLNRDPRPRFDKDYMHVQETLPSLIMPPWSRMNVLTTSSFPGGILTVHCKKLQVKKYCSYNILEEYENMRDTWKEPW